MGKKTIWIFSIGIAVVIVLIVTVYIILSSYNFNKLKPQISKVAKDATGRELILDGDIELKMGITPSLMVDRVSFQNAPWGSQREMAKIKYLEVKIALLPLIFGNMEIKRLIVVEPDILIETDPSGKSNLSFETAKEGEAGKQKKEEPDEEFHLPALTFNRVAVKNGRFTFKDGKSGKTYHATLKTLSVESAGASSPMNIDLKGTYNDNFFEIKGTSGSLMALADPEKTAQLNLTVKAGGATLNLKGTIRDTLKGKGLDLDVTAKGQSIPEAAKLAGVTDVPEVGPFDVAVKVADPDGKLAIKKLDVQIGSEELAQVKLTGAVKDPLARQGIDLNFVVRGKYLAKFEKLAGQPMPITGPFDISGQVSDLATNVYKVSDLKIFLGENDLGGRIEVNLTGKRPELNAEISSKKLDLRSLMKQDEEKGEKKDKPPQKKKRRDKVFPDDPLPLDVLKRADASIKFQAGKVLLPRLALNNLNAVVMLKDGHLTVKPLKSMVGGGTLIGHFSLLPQGDTAKLSASIEIDHLDLDKMLKELALTDIIEGDLDLDMDISGRGNSPAKLMAGLNGKVSVILGTGRINNKYIDVLGADLASVAFRLFNPGKKDETYTKINCFVSRFDIKDGIADSTALVFDTDLMSVAGEGTINLRTEGLDFSMKPSPKKGVGVSGVGKLSMNLGELAKPLKLSGTLAKPGLAIDPAKTAITIGKAVGGIILFGPIGIVAVLASGKLGGDENPCLAAIEAGEKGVKDPKEKKPSKEKSTVEKTTEGIKDAVEGIGGKLKKLFSK